MKLKKICVIVLILFLPVCFFLDQSDDVAEAHTTSYQLFLINQPRLYCTLIEGKIDLQKKAFQLEYKPSLGNGDKKLNVYVAEAVTGFTDLKIIGSFQIAYTIPTEFGKVTYSNPNLTRGKRFIVWASETSSKTLSLTEKKSILERAEAIFGEQDRLSLISAYKGSDAMVNQATFNYEE